MIPFPFRLASMVEVELPAHWFDDPNGKEQLDVDYWYLDANHPGESEFCQFYVYLFNERDVHHTVDDEAWESYLESAVKAGATSKLLQLLEDCRATGAAWAVLSAG